MFKPDFILTKHSLNVDFGTQKKKQKNPEPPYREAMGHLF